MSWDIDLAIDTTGGNELTHVVDVGNMTWNVSPMYYEAFGENGIKGLNGMLADEAILKVHDAIKYMEAEPDKFKAMNQPNGWGDYEGALAFLKKLLELICEHPKTTIRIT